MSCGDSAREFKVRERNGKNRHWEAKRFRLGKTEETVSSMSIGESNSNRHRRQVEKDIKT